jgi:hypothetical protein
MGVAMAGLESRCTLALFLIQVTTCVSGTFSGRSQITGNSPLEHCRQPVIVGKVPMLHCGSRRSEAEFKADSTPKAFFD